MTYQNGSIVVGDFVIVTRSYNRVIQREHLRTLIKETEDCVSLNYEDIATFEDYYTGEEDWNAKDAKDRVLEEAEVYLFSLGFDIQPHIYQTSIDRAMCERNAK